MRRRKATVTSVRARKVAKVILTFSEYNFFSERVKQSQSGDCFYPDISSLYQVRGRGRGTK